jgi:Protein of unknown function (DUF2800)
MNKQLPAVIDEDEIHAVYSPSAAKRWINCPGSINACKDLPKQKPNFYSAEGTLAHEIAAHFIQKKLDPFFIEVIPLVSKTDTIQFDANRTQTYGPGGKYTRKGFEIPTTQEMFDAIKTYVDFVVGLARKYDETPEIERRVKVTKECFGTTDCCLYVPYVILITNDYKHGAGIQVDAEMNEQMMIYAIGKLLEIPEDEQAEIPLIQMNIIQPRGSGDAIKTFEITRNKLIEWFTAVLIPAINAANQPDAPLNPGDWCKYCPAALTCPALKKENLAIAKLAFAEPVKWVDVLTPKAIADLLDKESMVIAFYKRLNEHAAELASKNTKIPGYTYQKKFGNRKWRDPKDAQAFLFNKGFTPEVIFKPQELNTPAAFEKAAKFKIKGSVMEEFVESPFTGYALKKANGKEITVKEVFNDVE